MMTRHMTRPAKDFVSPWQTVTTPHRAMMVGMKIDGRTRFRMRLQGTSSKMYGMKNMKSAML